MKNKITIICSVILIGFSAFYLIQNQREPITIHSDALFPELSKDELVQQSDIIVLGYVETTKSVKTPSDFRPGETDIITTATIKIENYLYNGLGLSEDTVQVESYGGTVGNITMDMGGAAVFTKGTNVLLFLKKKNDTTFTVYGWERGKYEIGTDQTIGASLYEQTMFKNIFGKNLTVDEISAEIESVLKGPKYIPTGVADENSDTLDSNMTSAEKNSAANAVLENANKSN